MRRPRQVSAEAKRYTELITHIIVNSANPVKAFFTENKIFFKEYCYGKDSQNQKTSSKGKGR